MNGEVLGNRYELLEKVGEGGMAIVYKARCNKLNRFVAVKILKKEYADNKEIVDKFKDEAMAVAKFSDSNIVNVLDVGSDDNINYIVMEFVNGKTLKQVVEQFGKLSCESTITIAMQVANALDCAHRNGIVHRDIKPQNILVTEEGVVKVTDFGIAKSTDSATLTNTSTILGSAHYFSPEQAKGGMVDNRSDIYSLGIVMYEMLTGKVPFEADSPVTIALKHIQEEAPALKLINPKVPESFNKIVLKCMAKDVNDRYKNVKELISDLQKIKENPEINLDEDKTTSSTGGETIIMAPIKDEDLIAMNSDNLDEDFEDDEELYDDYEEIYDDDDYEEEVIEKPKKEKKKSESKGIRNLLLGIAVAIIALVLIIGGFFMLVQTKPKEKVKEVQIPNIIGMLANDATNSLQNEGLIVQQKQVDSSEKEGTVISANPGVGTTVKEGSTVVIDISKGEQEIEVPDVSGMSQDEAIAQLKDAGFTIILTQTEYSDAVEKGNVIATTPQPGSNALKTSSITLIISKGSKYKEHKLPDLSNMTEAQARKALENLNLKIKVSSTNTTDESLNGKVVSFSPSAGTKVKEGSEVQVEIGKYEQQKIAIPTGLVNGDADAAVAALKNAGFTNVTTNFVENSAPKNTVISISPASGEVLPNTPIVVTASQGPQTPPTPPTSGGEGSGDNGSNVEGGGSAPGTGGQEVTDPNSEKPTTPQHATTNSKAKAKAKVSK